MIISLINKSTKYKKNNEVLKLISKAIDEQISIHLEGEYNLNGWKFIFVEDESKVSKKSHKIYLFDDVEQAENLGFGIEDSDKLNYGQVFINPILNSGGTEFKSENSISVQISHEACEIVADPEVNCWHQMKDGRLIAKEICDPVDGDFYTINVSGTEIAVSNFLLPSWFDSNSKSNDKFDYKGTLKEPFSLTDNGYMIQILKGNVTNIFGSEQSQSIFTENDSKFFEGSREVKRNILSYNSKTSSEIKQIINKMKTNTPDNTSEDFIKINHNYSNNKINNKHVMEMSKAINEFLNNIK